MGGIFVPPMPSSDIFSEDSSLSFLRGLLATSDHRRWGFSDTSPPLSSVVVYEVVVGVVRVVLGKSGGTASPPVSPALLVVKGTSGCWEPASASEALGLF